MAFALGSFAGGIGQGIEQGQNIRAKQQAAQLQALMAKGRQDFDAWLQSTTQAGLDPKQIAGAVLQPQQPPGGPSAGGGGSGVPPPSVPGGGASPPMGGAPPIPQQMAALSGPAAPGAPMNPAQAMAVLSNPSATQMPSGGAPPAAAPPPRDPVGPPAPTSSRSGPQPGSEAAGADLTPDAIAQQGKTAIQGVARDIASQFPGKKWKHGELLAAVETALDEQKKYFDPLAIQSAKVQLAFANAQIKQSEALAKLAQGDRKLDQGDRGLDIKQEGVEDTHADRQAAEGGRDDRLIKTLQSNWEKAQLHESSATARTGMEVAGRHQDVAARETGATARAGGAGGAMGNLKTEKAIDGTVVGKNYHTVRTAAENIKALAAEPDVTKDPAAQQGMIDAYVRMMTARGATKAQYDQFAKHMGFADFQSVVTNLADNHPIIGPRQIRTLLDAAGREETQARATAMSDPAVGPAIRGMEGGDTSPQPAAPSGAGKKGGVKRFKYDAQGNLLPQ